MIIRYLTQNDIVEHDKVSSQAFSIACDIHDPESVLPCENVLGAFDDDNKTLFADLEILERKCCYDGGYLTCAAIGGVAAKPEHRGKGAVKALFQHIIRESKYDISILYPFSEAYYRQFGYERAGHSVCLTVPFSELSGVKRNNDVTMFEGADTDRLLAVYNRCALQYNLCFVRENADAFSSEPYLSKRYTYIWKDRAFATIQIDRDRSTIHVEELYFDSCESMLGVVGFLRNFESNQKYLCFQKLPENSPLLYYITDLKPCDIRVSNMGSVRILHFEKVLRSHQYPLRDGTFTLQIADDVFKVSFSANGTTVEKSGTYDPDVVMDVPTASAVLLSGLANEAYLPGLDIRNPNSDFLRAFPPGTTFFTDGF